MYPRLPSLGADTFEETREIATKPGWQGYFSAPAKASAAYGRGVEDWWIGGMTDLILQAVRGQSLFGRPRDPEARLNARLPVIDEVNAHERDFELKLERWLSERAKR
jgi:hypothetical protein